VSEQKLPPVERSVSVSWDQETAFRRFALDFGKWWPSHTHSVGGSRVRRVVMEPRVGGRIYEEHKDGRRFQWGCIVAWEPPRRLAFTFHPARAAETAQHVEVRFAPNEGGTRVTLTACGWENWQPAKQAPLARRGYRMGWGYLLDVWAGRRTVARVFGAAAIVLGTVINALRGGEAGVIARSAGEIEAAPNDFTPATPRAKSGTSGTR
jgi:uncharacterized protein YndB with AHSA1/START domain